MPSLSSFFLLLIVIFNIMNKEWLGWERLGYTTISDLAMTLLVTTTIAYVVIDVITRLVKNNFFLSITKVIVLITSLIFLVVVPLWTNIMLRHTSVNYLLIHDGALQTEIAIRFLLKGENPYTMSYFGTPLEFWRYREVDHPTAVNPALYHYTYLPFFLLSSAVGQIIQKIVLGWEDLRFTLFAEYLGMLSIILLLTRQMKEKFFYFILFAANPLVVHFLLEGRNDTASFLYLLASAFFLSRKKLTTSAVFLAFGITFKQTLWLAVPFFLGYVFFTHDFKQKAYWYTGVVLVVSAIITLPFFLWSPKNFFDSTISYMNGATTHSYPINSIGFAQLLLLFHIIPDTHRYFPFWIFQFLAVTPLVIFFLSKLRGNPRISSLFAFFSVTVTVFFYFSRVFSDSYITLVSLTLLSALLFYQIEKPKATGAIPWQL